MPSAVFRGPTPDPPFESPGLVVLLLVAGITTATPIPEWFGAGASTVGPYPGWFYAVPLLIGTGSLALATWVALRRIASLPGEGLEALDHLWRSRTAQIILGSTTAAVGLHLGGTAVFAGLALGNAQTAPPPPGPDRRRWPPG